MKLLTAFGIIAFVTISCSRPTTAHKTTSSDDALQIVQAPEQPMLGGKRAMPFAYIYKTNGNYNANVAVTYDASTGTFTGYPDPADVSIDSEPLRLVDGWLLDRRGGVGPNTVFLRWTYDQYHRLTKVPTVKELKEAILPGARITEIHRLNMTTFDAQRDTAAVNRLILEILTND